jgi:hypothetical protein
VSQHPDPSALEPLLRGWSTMIAAAAGYADGRLAEGFLRVATA